MISKEIIEAHYFRCKKPIIPQLDVGLGLERCMEPSFQHLQCMVCQLEHGLDSGRVSRQCMVPS